MQIQFVFLIILILCAIAFGYFIERDHGERGPRNKCMYVIVVNFIICIFIWLGLAISTKNEVERVEYHEIKKVELDGKEYYITHTSGFADARILVGPFNEVEPDHIMKKIFYKKQYYGIRFDIPEKYQLVKKDQMPN